MHDVHLEASRDKTDWIATFMAGTLNVSHMIRIVYRLLRWIGYFSISNCGFCDLLDLRRIISVNYFSISRNYLKILKKIARVLTSTVVNG